MSRWNTSGFDTDIRPTERAIATLRLFDNYRLLPANWMHALLPERLRGEYRTSYLYLLMRMTRSGLLSRETLNGRRNNNETMTYSRTDCGQKEPCSGSRCARHFLHNRGFEVLPHDGTHDAHQILVDMVDAQIEMGVRKQDEVQLLKWQDIRDHPATPQLPKLPFRFDLGNTYVKPDGRPFALKAGHETILFLKELDRNTEEPFTIKTKLKHYNLLQNEIKKRYAFKSFMLLFVTTNTTRQENILRWVKSEIGDCKWVLTQVMTDHVQKMLSTAPVVTHLFDDVWRRACESNFSLKDLKSVSRPGITQEKDGWRLSQPGGFSLHPTEKAAYDLQQLNTQTPKPAKKPTKPQKSSYFEREIERYNEQGGFGFHPNVVKAAQERIQQELALKKKEPAK